MNKIIPTSGCFESLSKSHQNKVLRLVEEIRFFLKYKSDLSAYQVIFPQKICRKSHETVYAIWGKLDSKERHRLKEVGKMREHEK